ncbi:MAG: OB-fold nucleic acid binding domain-containing protein [Verrucomicrobiia bacterium]
MLRSNLDCHYPHDKITSAEKPRLRWLLPIFVAIAWTNLVGLVPTLLAEEPLTPIASIDVSLTNQAITVQAVVSAIQEPSGGRAPYIVSLTESNTTVPLVYWSDMQPQLAAKVKVGNVIRAKVNVKLYRNHPELQISGPDAIDLVSAAPAAASTNAPTEATASPAPSAAATPPPAAVHTVIGKIKEDWVGRTVVISGTISGTDNGDKSRRLSIQDATGEIQVVLGESELTGLRVDQLVPGRVVTITGPVKLLDRKPAVVPEAASVVTLAP